MEINESITYAQNSMDMIVNIIKTVYFVIISYYTNYKILNKKVVFNKKQFFNNFFIILTGILYTILKPEINYFVGIISLMFMIALIYSSKNIGNSIVVSTISLTINYAILIITITINFIINKVFKFNNDYVYLIFTIVNCSILWFVFWKIKRFKYGISFLQKDTDNEYMDILVLNISVLVLLLISIVVDSNITLVKDFAQYLIIYIFIMFITIQKSFKLYYKQKLLEQELNKTKDELASKIKDNEQLETENISISKKAHTLDHKQKSLAKKIDEMMMNTEISKEEVAEVKERLNKIGKDLYKEKTTIELSKTGIAEIDDMLSYMQTECEKNKIDFELQVKGNIYHMTNNLISIEDLETLLADHIKNAIIAINHTDNVNRSILVRLGEIDGIYSLYIYDSGIEFVKETLENLGKKPSTTHADEGGTGMGFMNTFDTLRKCKASLIIEEIGEPTKDNYTKAIIIKFDNKNDFKINTYR